MCNWPEGKCASLSYNNREFRSARQCLSYEIHCVSHGCILNTQTPTTILPVHNWYGRLDHVKCISIQFKSNRIRPLDCIPNAQTSAAFQHQIYIMTSNRLLYSNMFDVGILSPTPEAMACDYCGIGPQLANGSFE